ncbi:MAG: Zn-ribbon domain-containing OB-fold protein [Dehalococcoidia bacterium]
MNTAEQASRKPIPQPDDASRPFFDGARRGVLMIERCLECQVYLAPGSFVCSECLGDRLEWVQASGRGTLFTFAIMHQRYHPGFAAELPYNIAVVELEEGPRLNTSIVGVRNEDLRVGIPLLVTFEQLSAEVSLPKFRSAG